MLCLCAEGRVSVCLWGFLYRTTLNRVWPSVANRVNDVIRGIGRFFRSNGAWLGNWCCSCECTTVSSSDKKFSGLNCIIIRFGDGFPLGDDKLSQPGMSNVNPLDQPKAKSEKPKPTVLPVKTLKAKPVVKAT